VWSFDISVTVEPIDMSLQPRRLESSELKYYGHDTSGGQLPAFNVDVRFQP